uniref:PH domain containing protein n=1 Tax=Myoviridae sp. ctplG2 TaxID=2826700 RepID=A0A8S5LWL2_9CAUD|nr:MAG TPA: PH domain containing protein [Myoviridae sp. ctplG2]
MQRDIGIEIFLKNIQGCNIRIFIVQCRMLGLS